MRYPILLYSCLEQLFKIVSRSLGFDENEDCVNLTFGKYIMDPWRKDGNALKDSDIGHKSTINVVVRTRTSHEFHVAYGQ